MPILLVSLSQAHAGSLGARASYILDQHWVTLSQNGQKFLTLGRFLVEGGRDYRGVEVHYSMLANHGGHSPSSDIGDGQIVSNIDTEGVESLKVYEFYLVKSLGFLKVSVGWRDLLRLYNVTEAATLFVNSSFTATSDWGTTGFRGPSIYPQISFGAQVWMQLTPELYLATAVADPLTPENYYPKQLQTHILLNQKNHMAVSEIGYKNSLGFHVAVGAWNLQQDQRGLRSLFEQRGTYGMLAGRFWKKLNPFVRYGQASRNLGSIYENTVVGLNLQKVFGKNKLDELGLGYTAARLDGVEPTEEIYEMIYRYNHTSRLSFALSSQWVINPFFSNQDGQVLTFRIQIQSQNNGS